MSIRGKNVHSLIPQAGRDGWMLANWNDAKLGKREDESYRVLGTLNQTRQNQNGDWMLWSIYTLITVECCHFSLKESQRLWNQNFTYLLKLFIGQKRIQVLIDDGLGHILLDKFR